MAKAKALSTYRILDPKSLLALIGDLKDVRALLGTPPEAWQIREVGDGNLNLVFIVQGPDGSVCVKQALPYVRAAGPSCRRREDFPGRCAIPAGYPLPARNNRTK